MFPYHDAVGEEAEECWNTLVTHRCLGFYSQALKTNFNRRVVHPNSITISAANRLKKSEIKAQLTFSETSECSPLHPLPDPEEKPAVILISGAYQPVDEVLHLLPPDAPDIDLPHMAIVAGEYALPHAAVRRGPLDRRPKPRRLVVRSVAAAAFAGGLLPAAAMKIFFLHDHFIANSKSLR